VNQHCTDKGHHAVRDSEGAIRRSSTATGTL
jgi:hypothetical protein